MTKYSGFLIMALCAFSCKKDVEELQIQYSEFSPQLWSHLATFEKEAAKRNRAFDLNKIDIKGTIEEIEQNNVAGICHYQSHNPNQITIDASFWQRADHLTREFVVFHELGHCVLGRLHKEDMYPDGRCKSIMQSGTRSCVLKYNGTYRSTYLDELFGSY